MFRMYSLFFLIAILFAQTLNAQARLGVDRAAMSGVFSTPLRESRPERPRFVPSCERERRGCRGRAPNRIHLDTIGYTTFF